MQAQGASHQGVLYGQIAAVLGVVVVGVWGATQWTAAALGHQARLGAPWFVAFDQPVYHPWRLFEWWFFFDAYAPDVFDVGGAIAGCSGIASVCVAVSMSVWRSRQSRSVTTYGTARWATADDVRQAGLNRPGGVFLGQHGEQYLRHDGPEHVLAFAPTRSGKGVGLVVPTLLSWGASSVITDLKGELWALTAGWRQKHAKNKVLRFEPASTSGGVCWNPLDEIRLGTEYEVGDVQNLATLIVDPDGKGLDSHWQKTAFALLVGVILHALYKAKDDGGTATLPSVDAMLADPNRDIGELWMEMATYGHVDGQNHHAIGSAARDMMDRPEEEAGSVLSTAKSYLALYRDPVVARNVSRSDFRIKQLMHEDDPVSLYIVTQPNDKARLRPLVRVMVNMIVRLLADKMDFEGGRPVAHYKHRLLMMLDEFPSLGKLEIMQESLAFVAGYGIKCYLICQDINQLKSRETGYGHDESITSNCHVQNAYPPNRVETAEHLSRLTGQTTVVKEQITTSGRRTAAMLGQVSRTYQEVQRPLLTPDECLRMPGPKKNAQGEIEEAGDMVIYVAGYPAIYGKQPLYFKDPVFSARAAIPAPKVSDRLRAVAQAETEGEGITI